MDLVDETFPSMSKAVFILYTPLSPYPLTGIVGGSWHNLEQPKTHLKYQKKMWLD